MNIFEAIILGIIQGITEFLPISSTAHLTLAGKIMGIVRTTDPEDWTAFMAIMQLGTVAAVILHFFEDYLSMGKHFLNDYHTGKLKNYSQWSTETRLASLVVIGTVPVVIIGLLFKDFIEGAFTKELSTIATSLIALALLLFWAEKIGKHNRDEQHTTWWDALIVGFAQALALIPGSSRSGTTITAGLFLGLDRETAARFSFHLSIPAVLASGFYQFYEARHHIGDIGIDTLLVSSIVAGIVGYWSISFLLKYLQKHTTYIFISYRILLGIAIWIYILYR
ncbi:MAG: undecaprenyl-diphosphatase UppP [Ignavibacteriales bacterium]|nr:undecaprenyl-diphosphatase UppP [Ignavibacteriales bacterium]